MSAQPPPVPDQPHHQSFQAQALSSTSFSSRHHPTRTIVKMTTEVTDTSTSTATPSSQDQSESKSAFKKPASASWSIPLPAAKVNSLLHSKSKPRSGWSVAVLPSTVNAASTSEGTSITDAISSKDTNETSDARTIIFRRSKTAHAIFALEVRPTASEGAGAEGTEGGITGITWEADGEVVKWMARDGDGAAAEGAAKAMALDVCRFALGVRLDDGDDDEDDE